MVALKAPTTGPKIGAADATGIEPATAQAPDKDRIQRQIATAQQIMSDNREILRELAK